MKLLTFLLLQILGVVVSKLTLLISVFLTKIFNSGQHRYQNPLESSMADSQQLLPNPSSFPASVVDDEDDSLITTIIKVDFRTLIYILVQPLVESGLLEEVLAFSLDEIFFSLA